MSTAIERIMRERGDFDCLHEPFLHYYYLNRTDRPLPHFASDSSHPRSYEATRDLVLRRAQKSPVFAKDMSYYVMPEILRDVEFCRRLRHCFLLRNPLHSILSYYRLDADVSLREIGIEQQWRQLQGLQALGIDDSIVIEAEAVQRDAAASMRAFWQALGLDYRASALSWDHSAPPPDWQYVSGWHRSVSASSGIESPSGREQQARVEAFAQLCRDAPHLSDYLRHHLPFYEKLRRFSLTAAAHDD
jgi:hypothetical protein